MGENNSRLEKEVAGIGKDVRRVSVRNWPGGLAYYTDADSKQIERNYTPRIVPNRIGVAFPPKERQLEEAVHPIVAMAGITEEFCGFDIPNLQKAVECINWYLEEGRHDFRATSCPEAVQAAVAAGYLREREIEGKSVYFPTQKSVSAMCNKRFEDFMFSLAMLNDTCIGTGHRRI